MRVQESGLRDPLADVVALLQPRAPASKLVSARGPWRVRRSESGRLFYCAMLEGTSRLAAHGAERTLRAGDFALIPSAYEFCASSLVPPAGGRDTTPVALPDGEYRHGERRGAPDVRMLIGYCELGSPDATLLVSLLPRLVHVHGHPRLGSLVALLGDEARARRPGRDVVLARLLEVLMIEALRSTAGPAAPPGLLRGLADERLAVALRRMHAAPARAWTVALLAREAALSRSTFFERFHRAVGVTPMAYLLGWRMALAKEALRRPAVRVAEVAREVGYGSASTFSVAFTRHVGLPPTRFARTQGGA